MTVELSIAAKFEHGSALWSIRRYGVGIPLPAFAEEDSVTLPLDWRRGDNELKWGRDRRFTPAYIDTIFETDPKDRLL